MGRASRKRRSKRAKKTAIKCHKQARFASKRYSAPIDVTRRQKGRGHGTVPLNPPFPNDRDIGHASLAQVKPSPYDCLDDTFFSNADTIPETCFGVDMFLFPLKRAERDRGPSRIPACLPERSLADLYADNPDLRLENIGNDAMQLVGITVKQIVLEATHEFLQNSIPEKERQNVWSQIFSGNRIANSEAEDGQTIIPIIISPKKLRIHKSRPLSHLIDNCVSILTGDFSTSDSKALRVAFDRGIALCDALQDERRRKALGKAAGALSWLALGLDCKKMIVYQHLNKELDRINHCLSMKWLSHAGTERMEISKERRGAERAILESSKRLYDTMKEPFGEKLVQVLQQLMALVN